MAIIKTSAEGPSASGIAPARRRSLTLDGFREIFVRWRLIRYLVGADLKRTHNDTALGQLWWLLDPLLQMLVYAFLFTVILQRDTPDFLLFLLAAILPWKWFSTTVNSGMGSVVSRQGLIRQVNFPKIVLPTATAVAELVSFCVGLVALAVLFIPYHDRLSIWILTFPLIAFVQFVLGLAISIALSAANAFYRDVSNVMTHLIRLAFYMSPALYALWDVKHETLRALMMLNPFAVILTAYRTAAWGTDTIDHGTQPDFIGLGIVLLLSLVLLAVAVWFFKRVEPVFARIL